jgi:hypothetical protein
VSPRLARPLLALAASLLLAGCWPPDFKIIDQRTFAPPHAPTEADLARAHLPPAPLVTIRFDNPDADYAPALADAVTSAEARKPDVEFDVLTPIPTSAPQATQDEFARQGADDAQAVLNALGADGIRPDRVHLGYRADPGSPPREVLVYVR